MGGWFCSWDSREDEERNELGSTSKVLVVQATVSFLLIIFLLSRLDGIRACYSDLDGLMHFISQ